LAKGRKTRAAHAAEVGEFERAKDSVSVLVRQEAAKRFIARLALVGINPPAQRTAVRSLLGQRTAVQGGADVPRFVGLRQPVVDLVANRTGDRTVALA